MDPEFLTVLEFAQEPVLLHRFQMRTARDQRDIYAGAREHAAKMRADCPCAIDRNLHTGATLPGFMMFCGSSARFSCCMTS